MFQQYRLKKVFTFSVTLSKNIVASNFRSAMLITKKGVALDYPPELIAKEILFTIILGLPSQIKATIEEMKKNENNKPQ